MPFFNNLKDWFTICNLFNEVKKYYYVIFILSICFVCSSYNQTENIEGEFSDIVMQQYKSDFSLFINEVENLVALTKDTTESKLIIDIQKQVKATRLAYKKVEFLFDYFESEYNYLYINGGPLPKLTKQIAEIDYIPPNGLQTIDELAYQDDTLSIQNELFDLSQQLLERAKFVAENSDRGTIDKRELIEALRLGIVRLFTLGLTGFDTPGSANAMPEALVSLQSMQAAFLFFENNTADKKAFKNVLYNFEHAILLIIINPEFDTFDRLQFLKEAVNPLYENLKTFQQLEGISEGSNYNHAINFNSENLFDEDFIDTYYYSQYSLLPLENEERIALGKLLFNDPILSLNVNMSCASCHAPDKAFTDNLPKSKTSQHNNFTKRNSPTLIDATYSSRYFWDMREYDLEKQVAHVMADSLEFNMSFKTLAKRLTKSNYYNETFKEIYGGISKDYINERSISNAIAAYVNSLRSFNSNFDQYIKGENDDLNESAKNGFNLFMGKAACGTCHFAPVFNGSVPPYYKEAESEVLGITLGFDTLNVQMDNDAGRIANGIQEDFEHFKNSFKTVTVRNAELTAPYMHNGLFNTLEEVIQFYNVGGGVGMGLPIDNQTLAGDSLHLSNTEQTELIAFLKSLTDTTGLNSTIYKLPQFEDHPYWNNRTIDIIDD